MLSAFNAPFNLKQKTGYSEYYSLYHVAYYMKTF